MKKLLYLVPVLIILFLLAAFFIGQRNRGVGVLPTPTPAGDISVVGRQICLPHRDTTGPQTMECALGIAGEDGNNYSLDLTAVGDDVLSGGDAILRIEGVFTPVEALSNDFWQKYDMVGIITVSSVVEI